MRTIEIDGSAWKTDADPHDAIARAQHAIDGRAVANPYDINGLLELLVWDVIGERDALPRTFRIVGTSQLPLGIKDEIAHIQRLLADARAETVARYGYDVEVFIEVVIPEGASP